MSETMNPNLIPALDSTPIPGPAWLFHVLLVFTFVLHVLFMNTTLGGTLLAAIAQTLSGGKEGDPRTILATRLMGVNVYSISLTITTGVAPLLFVQVLFQQYFYTATILLGWIWFGFLVLLMIGYYAAYLYKFRGAPTQGSGGTVWLWVSAVTFLLIAMVHVAVALIHSQPDTWAAIAANPWSVLGDPTYFPRLLHFLLAAVAFSALVLTWWSVRQASQDVDVELNTKIAGFCWKWAFFSTIAVVFFGIVLLITLPMPVLTSLMQGGIATLGPLMLAILLGLGLLMMLSRVQDPTQSPGLVNGTLAGMVLTIAIMAITRHQVRLLYLEPVTSKFELATAPQWGNFVLFTVLLVAGLLTVAYMVREVLNNPATGEQAA